MLDAPPADVDAERVHRRWVLRVVRGEWILPAPAVDELELGEPRGVLLMCLAAVRDVVVRFLVSDPCRRARVGRFRTNRGWGTARLWRIRTRMTCATGGIFFRSIDRTSTYCKTKRFRTTPFRVHTSLQLP
jgi:hypothetical protein